jgi:SulP family sulfate permease
MAGSEPQRAVASAAFAIAVGLMCLLSGAFRLGFIANFLSRPNFDRISLRDISRAADQSDRSTVSVEAKGVLRPLIALGSQLMQVHMPTLVFGMGILLLLRLLRWWSPRAPRPLVAVIVGTLQANRCRSVESGLGDVRTGG